MHVIAFFESLDLTIYSNIPIAVNILLLSSFIFFTSASNFLEEWYWMMNDNKPFEASNNVIDAKLCNKNVGITLLRRLFSKRSIKDQFYILCTKPRFCHYKSILKNQIHLKFPLFMVKHFEPLSWNPCLRCHCDPLYIFVMWIFSNHVALTRIWVKKHN